MPTAERSGMAMLNVLEDLTAAKAEVDHAHAFDEALLSSMADGVLAVDSQNRIIEVNEAALTMLGCQRQDLLHKDMIQVVPMFNDGGTLVPPEERFLRRALQLDEYRIFSDNAHYYSRTDGSRFAVAIDWAPIILNSRNVGAVEIFRDITREREVDRAKSEFVSLASHQLRTPLTAIEWYSGLLLENKDKLDSQQLEYLTEVHEANRRMIELVDSLLNVSRIELGTFAVEPESILAVSVIKNVLKDLIAPIQKKHLKIEEVYGPDVATLFLSADSRLLMIIMQNVISNAVKYTPDGGLITINARRDAAWVEILVIDTGIGIPVHDQSKIYSKLFRSDNARRADPDGTGLGLYMTRMILQAIGGSISFESEENKGTTFTVRIPLAGMPAKQGTQRLIV